VIAVKPATRIDIPAIVAFRPLNYVAKWHNCVVPPWLATNDLAIAIVERRVYVATENGKLVGVAEYSIEADGALQLTACFCSYERRIEVVGALVGKARVSRTVRLLYIPDDSEVRASAQALGFVRGRDGKQWE